MTISVLHRNKELILVGTLLEECEICVVHGERKRKEKRNSKKTDVKNQFYAGPITWSVHCHVTHKLII